MQVTAARQAATAAWVRPSVFLAGRRPSAASGSLSSTAAHLRHHLHAGSRQHRPAAAEQQAAAAEEKAGNVGQPAGPSEASQRVGKRKVALFIGYEGTEYRGTHSLGTRRHGSILARCPCMPVMSDPARLPRSWPASRAPGQCPVLSCWVVHASPTCLLPPQAPPPQHASRSSPTRRCTWQPPPRPPWRMRWRRPSSEPAASCHPTAAS